MSRVSKKFIKLGTNSDEISGSDIPANHSETNYTSSSSDIAGHLDGVDSALGAKYQKVSGDLDQVSFSLTNNQLTFADVTGVAFSNGVTRSAELQYSVSIDATSDLYESGKIMAIQRGSDWVISVSSNGDNSQVLFDISASGQLQYKSANLPGFVSGTLKVRALSTSV